MARQARRTMREAADQELTGFALLSTGAIRFGQVYLRGVMMNRTAREVVIEWSEQFHEFELVITDAQGSAWNYSDHRDPPQAKPPLIIPAAAQKTQEEVSIQIALESSPQLGLEFRLERSPYTFDVRLNTTVIPASARLILPVHGDP